MPHKTSLNLPALVVGLIYELHIESIVANSSNRKDCADVIHGNNTICMIRPYWPVWGGQTSCLYSYNLLLSLGHNERLFNGSPLTHNKRLEEPFYCTLYRFMFKWLNIVMCAYEQTVTILGHWHRRRTKALDIDHRFDMNSWARLSLCVSGICIPHRYLQYSLERQLQSRGKFTCNLYGATMLCQISWWPLTLSSKYRMAPRFDNHILYWTWTPVTYWNTCARTARWLH